MMKTPSIYNDDIYKLVNYKKIYSIANEYLATASEISRFPYKVSPFLNGHSDISLCSYKKAKEKYGVDIKTFGSESAVIMESNGAYIIFINQDEKEYRLRFSLLHEFAHFILNHKLNLALSDRQYRQQELEANCFAAQMLMPEQILRECSSRGKRIDTYFIKQVFDVSDEAAHKRKLTLASTVYEWKSRAEKQYDDIILSRFSHIIDAVAPVSDKYFYMDDEYELQRERDSWLDSRSRWQ